MTRTLCGVLLAVTTLACQAENGFNGSLQFATDSLWRGVSQTNNRPVVEGDFSYETKIGFYLGETMSNVDYGSEDPASLESATYLGYSHTFGDDITLDMTISRYTYPAIHSYDFNEYHAAFTYKNTTATLEYADNYFNANYPAYYGELAYNHDFPKEFSLGGSIGYFVKDDDEGNYLNLRAYLNKRYKEIKFEVAVSHTPDRPRHFDSLGHVRAVFSISKDFS